MSFSFGFLLAACRIRSAPLGMTIQFCAWFMASPPVFPLIAALRSSGSARAPARLFAAFPATMPASDFFASCVLGFGFLPSLGDPGGDPPG